MELFTIKQHDTWPPIVAVLSDQDGVADLSSVDSLKLLASRVRPKPEVLIAGVAEVVGDPLEGRVSYTWQSGDTDEIGTYTAEWEITYLGGAVTTFPNYGYFHIKITDDLG